MKFEVRSAKEEVEKATGSAVPSGLMGSFGQLPNVETLGYFQTSLRDEEGEAILVVLDDKSALPGQRSAAGHSTAQAL
jgi:hypothetical protein